MIMSHYTCDRTIILGGALTDEQVAFINAQLDTPGVVGWLYNRDDDTGDITTIDIVGVETVTTYRLSDLAGVRDRTVLGRIT